MCYTFTDGGGIAVFQSPPNATQEAYGLYSTFAHERAFAHEAPIRVTLVQDEPSAGMYRYTVTYRPVGMTIIFH